MTSIHDRPQARIGDCEVLEQLALGGMAEILLGRITGPGGFERAVVIKRILPQLAHEAAFRSMFIDEARIVSGIRHPNVVQVYQLGIEQGELYLVMDYVEGEHLGSLLRRACRTGRRVPFEIACHVLAEACAGLHAAHELTSPDGVPLEIVHRDIAPQNIAVGFDGSVKLLDFGIAKARDRITRTEAGQLKGHYAYMSPEQASGAIVDRRTDVFSIGVVLFELTTGRRLFRHDNPLATLNAVTKARVPPPSTLVDDYPQALERVCLRALSRDPDARFASAGALRRALVEVQARLAPGLVGDEAVAALLRELMPERIEAKRRLLAEVRTGRVRDVPEAEVDPDVEPPTILIDLPVPERARTRRWAVVAAFAAAASLGAIAAGIAISDADDPREAASAPVRGDAPPLAAPPTETEQDARAVDAGAADAPAISPSVVLTLISEPPGATFHAPELDQPLVAPATVTVARSSEALRFQVSLEAHRPIERAVVPETDRTVEVELAPARPRRRPHRRPPPPASDSRPGASPFEAW